jgi:hypothetical protein
MVSGGDTVGGMNHGDPGSTTGSDPTGHRPPEFEPGSTGDAEVDEAVRALDAIQQLPVHEHATVVEGVHRALQDRLAESQG